MLRTLIIAIVVSLGLAGASSAQTREGADFISGRWVFAGQYENGDDSINFWTVFSPDGTCVDRDNYRCRWIISGSSFVMFYPDESELGYVGAISGQTVSGRFSGKDSAGVFRMARGN